MNIGNTKTSIKVTYKGADDWHVFTSNEVPGLLVASKDVKEAYEDIPQSIEMFMLLNEEVECTVEPEVAIVEFLRRLKSKGKAFDVPKFYMTDHRFALRAAA